MTEREGTAAVSGCACDWPGCTGACHTGDTCPCHPAEREGTAAEDGLRAALAEAERQWYNGHYAGDAYRTLDRAIRAALAPEDDR